MNDEQRKGTGLIIRHENGAYTIRIWASWGFLAFVALAVAALITAAIFS
jgi:hypothetical protein